MTAVAAMLQSLASLSRKPFGRSIGNSPFFDAVTSLRSGSFNAQLARAVVKLAPADFGIHFLTAAGMPATMCSKRPRESSQRCNSLMRIPMRRGLIRIMRSSPFKARRLSVLAETPPIRAAS